MIMSKYPAKFARNDEKRREIAQIHIGRQYLGMDDETYRAMLWTVARVRSSTELDHAGRKQVIDHLKALGWKPSFSSGRPPVEGSKNKALLGKIEALLADQRLPWAYVTASSNGRPSMLKRLAGVDNFVWAKPEGLRAVIAALEVRNAKAVK